MSKITLIVGGTRSGKSSYAVERAKTSGKKTLFIATAAPGDAEMQARIQKHKLSRPKKWETIEEERNLAGVLSKAVNNFDLVIVDCLGLLISNLICDGLSDENIQAKINGIISALEAGNSTVLLISNDVGSGIMPDNQMARRFIDIIGFANQALAKKADEVIFMQLGIAKNIKGKK